MKPHFLAAFWLGLLSSAPLLLTGCGQTQAAPFTGQRQPPLGRDCTVQFRRDFLGTSRELPVPPTANSINGAETSVRGVLTAVTDEWIVLSHKIPVGNLAPVEREFWIPRSSVLLVETAAK